MDIGGKGTIYTLLWQPHKTPHSADSLGKSWTYWKNWGCDNRVLFSSSSLSRFHGGRVCRDTRKNNNHHARSEENLHQSLRILLLGLDINILVSFIPEREGDGVLY